MMESKLGMEEIEDVGMRRSEKEVGLMNGLQGPVRQQGCWSWGAKGLTTGGGGQKVG